jgi:FkbM family methyltransferase
MKGNLARRVAHLLPRGLRARLLRVPGAVKVYHVLNPPPQKRITRAIERLQQVSRQLDLTEVRLSAAGAFFRSPTGAEFAFVPDWGAYGAEYGLAHEQAEVEYAADRVPQGSVVFDVGANLGTFCINLAVLRPDLTIHAFEPVGATYSWLEVNIRRNGVEDRVVPHRLAVLDRAGDVEVTTGRYTDNLLVRSPGVGTERVPGRRLDDLAHELGDPTLLKIDVEGAEPLVLLGGMQLLLRARADVLLEVQDSNLAQFGSSVRELEGLLTRAGYTWLPLDRLHPVNRVYVADRSAAVH